MRIPFFKNQLFFVFLFFWIPYSDLKAQPNTFDSIAVMEYNQKCNRFYDSLEYKANKKKITRVLYKLLFPPSLSTNELDRTSFEYYDKFKGKIISEIKIISLDVFGPTFKDTTQKATTFIEKTANTIHSKSNLKTIKRMLLFKEGDFFEPELMCENERIIRALQYIQDVRFIVEQDKNYKGLVKVSVITKDRFSIGISGGVNGNSSAAFEIYDQNIFGVGHEVSLKFVGHLNRQPYAGLETFYKINNIKGKFIDVSAGYMNTYQREGFSFIFDKPFITPTIKWGYGVSAVRMFRTNRISDYHPIKTSTPMDLSRYSIWGGRSFDLNSKLLFGSQLVASLGMYSQHYYKRPVPVYWTNHYFSNSTFILGGLTFLKRRYFQDQLVYSYGVIEDIPRGFKNEIIYGFDVNQYGNRHYTHLFLSNGDVLPKNMGYLYLSAGIGGYFKNKKFEQGQIQGSMNFISKQCNVRNHKARFFARADYLLGVRRFGIENINLNKDEFIRGFSSQNALGKNRLSLDLEGVLFFRRDFYRFKMALFGFADLGFIGSNRKIIFTQDFYSGVGIGLRLHNENLVFKTVQLRLAFYPSPPEDMDFVGLTIEEQSKRRYYDLQPMPPQTLKFE